MAGPRASAARTAAATATRRKQKKTPDPDTDTKTPSPKPRPKPIRKQPQGHTNLIAGTDSEVDFSPGKTQRQETFDEPAIQDEDDRNYDDSGSVNGNFNEDYSYSDGEHGYTHDTSWDDDLASDHGGNTTWAPDQRNTRSWSTPVLDEYGSEPDQYLQQDGESISPPASHPLSPIDVIQKRRRRRGLRNT